jgi:hypothetical protein
MGLDVEEKNTSHSPNKGKSRRSRWQLQYRKEESHVYCGPDFWAMSCGTWEMHLNLCACDILKVKEAVWADWFYQKLSKNIATWYHIYISVLWRL